MLHILWIIASLSVCPNFGETRRTDETLAKFVADATTTMFSPSRVTALLCVDDDERFRFARELSRNRVIHNVRRSMENLDPITFRSDVDHQNFFLLDLDCPAAVETLRKQLIQASERGMFVAPAQWLLLQDLRKPKKNAQNSSKPLERSAMIDDSVTWIHKTFNDFKIYPDSAVILARRVDDTAFLVLSCYRPSPQRDLILEDRGYWNRDEGLVMRDSAPASRRRRDLRKTELRSGLVVTNPDTLNHLEDYQDKLVDAVTKANYPWVIHLANRMNATLTFTVHDSWGYRDKNGTWSGMIGSLVRGEADIGGTATFLVSERLGVIEYFQLYTPTCSKFLFRRPPLSYVSNLFTLPFGRNVWIATGTFIVLVIPLLFLSMKWEYTRKGEAEEDSKMACSLNIDEEPSLSNDLLVIIGAVSQQGSAYEPRGVPTRIIVLVLLMATLSLYASYTANIVALLQSTATSINRPRDLMNSPLKIAIYDIIYNRYFFKTYDDPERREFYQKRVDGKDVWLNLTEGIRRVRQGLFAFHVEVGAGYQVIQETFEEGEKCGIHEIDYMNMMKPLLILPIRSPYSEIMRVGGLWLRETGLQYREVSRLYPEKPVCHGHNSFLSVGIIDCYAALMTMVYGAGITLIVLGLEIAWHKCTTQREPEEIADIEVAE